MFALLYQLIREDGSLRPRYIGGRPRQKRTPAFEEEMLERIGNDPSTSTRAMNLLAYHLQKVQGLGPNNFAPRARLVQWFLQRSIVNHAFPAQVLFIDEACFTRNGYFNSRNSHI